MGHGDEIVIGDANFPSQSISEADSKYARVVRLDGCKGVDVLAAVLQLLPLDEYVPAPVAVMSRVPSDEARGVNVSIWQAYQRIVDKAEHKPVKIEQIERFKFYERAKKCYAVVASGETALYANIILKKGVLPDPSVVATPAVASADLVNTSAAASTSLNSSV